MSNLPMLEREDKPVQLRPLPILKTALLSALIYAVLHTLIRARHFGPVMDALTNTASFITAAAPFLFCIIALHRRSNRIYIQLSEEKRFTATILENMDELVCVCDEFGQLVYMNKDGIGQGSTVISPPMPPEQWIARYEVKLPDDNETLIPLEKTPLIRALRGSPVSNMELSALGFLFQASSRPIVGVNGELLGAVAVLSNITKRVEAENRLKQSEKHLRDVFEAISCGVVVVNDTGRIEHVNEAACLITGMSRDQVRDLPTNYDSWNFIEEDGTPLPMDRHPAYITLSTGKPTDTVLGFINKDRADNIRWLLIHSNPLFADESGSRLSSVIITFVDITERKNAMDLLQKLEKLRVIGQLAAGVAHEIRNPLTTIRGFLQLHRGRFDNPGTVELMLSELDRINMIISEFLVLAKPQATRFQLTDLRDTMRRVITFMESETILTNVGFELYTDPDLPPVRCEENQIKQVFINIIKNAQESMPSGGTIRADLNRSGQDKVVIRITDQGCGISDDQMSRLGEPFYTTKDTGTGLGLMISYKIVENHGGSLRIKSNPGSGTSVVIELPAATVN
ncbi:PAS domain S-box protein [Paenibacillus mesophilus]|uniref:ATP-binding protein n=1 Tax=Paenibacillus mesophilus TaxID=2582849 RepID=UPI00110E02FD|nr:ATP-binding protein [Paenibacillus mesophilus]TMV43118.1 PAS domain S-box protein [Paenibacillus mesophilus]